ncbi:MAG: NAD(P)/FAD-dependent oxidoreductase, partial [Clostridia bacterium]|nr:NAD(P)/FAD-dependent oxidoreductase [Clostridia bacterium]
MKKVLNLKVPVTAQDKDILFLACKKSGLKLEKIKYFKILKKSLDARNKQDIFYSVNLEISEKLEVAKQKEYKKVKIKANVLVVGAGPAGLFCALDLLRFGLNVTLIERGQSVDERVLTVKNFTKNGVLN